MPELKIAQPADLQVWRVGYKPDPWAWSDWSYASDGRFNGRWDDPNGTFRTLYTGTTLLACLLEVLAYFRPDPRLAFDIAEIIHNAEPESLSTTTVRSGLGDPSWLDPRTIGRAQLTGRFCSVTASSSIATLRATFIDRTLRLGLADFDAAALKDSRARPLTQAIAAHLYKHPAHLDGILFASRHGDDLALWAIFERDGDSPTSRRLRECDSMSLSRDHPDLRQAFRIHGLRWSDDHE